MSLRWLHGQAVVDENVFLPGKDLDMEATNADPVPREFELFQLYSSAMRQILKHVGVPERRALTSFDVVAGAQGAVRSDRPWKLAAPRGPRKSATYVFTAEAATSGHIYSSRIGKARLKAMASAKAGLQDPTGSLQIGVEGRAELEAIIRLAVDPELVVTVLTGDDLVEHMIANLRSDVVREDDEDTTVAARVETSLDELTETLREAYTAPYTWSAELNTTFLTAAEGETVTVTLQLETPDPGTGYFAVSVADSADETGERAETTDVWAVQANEAGAVTVIQNPDQLELPKLQLLNYA